MTEVKIGELMPDGSIFAGLTADGQQQIYAMPTDLDITLSFNNAAKAVEKLNNSKALGHDDWQVPSLESLRILCKNQNKGCLKDTFNKLRNKDVGFGYWSSERDMGSEIGAFGMRFTDGYEFWVSDRADLSCRPVRLVPVKP